MGGTLVEDRDFEAFCEIAEQVGIAAHPDDLAEAVRWGMNEFDRPGSDPGRSDYWAAVLSRASKSDVPTPLVRTYIDRLRRLPRVPHLFSDVRRCLERLTEDRRLLGVVSNSWSEEGVRYALRQVGILGFFSVIVSSGTEGVAKPEKEIFLRAAQRIGVAPAEAFYVGDLPNTDARAAAAAGMHSVWLHRDGDGLGDDPPEITSLSELPKLVSRTEGASVK
jgi:HAD superfamily hydrolase (TIGR01509 family)